MSAQLLSPMQGGMAKSPLLSRGGEKIEVSTHAPLSPMWGENVATLPLPSRGAGCGEKSKAAS